MDLNMDIMGILAWIVFGALAGWIASLIAGKDKKHGLLGNVIVGIIGAFLGGFLMTFLDREGITGFNLYSLLVAVGGAVIVLFLKKKLMK